MEQHQRSGDPAEQTATLLTLAEQLRAAAADAGRPEVAAKVQEAIVLIAGGRDATDTGATADSNGKADTVVRILNGLGY